MHDNDISMSIRSHHDDVSMPFMTSLSWIEAEDRTNIFSLID